MVTLDDASLGLLAFCFLVWITLPSAFSERIDALLTINAQPLETEYGEEGTLGKPRGWLEAASGLYATSGTFFLITVLVDLSKPTIPELANFYTPIFFLLGSVALTAALYYTRLVIKFVLHPQVLPNTLFQGIELNSLPNAAIVLTNLLLDALVVYALLPELITGIPRTVPQPGEVLLGSAFLSLGGIALLICVRKRSRSSLNALGSVLVFLPFFVLMYVILGGLL